MTSSIQYGALAGEILDPSEKDWTFLQTKAPSSVHELHAKAVTELSGVEISPKQVQALLAMHRWIQKSEANRNRPDFHGRTWDSVLKGSATLAERAAEKPGEAPVNTAKGIVLVDPEEASEEAKPEVEAKQPEAKPAPKATTRRRTAAKPAAKKEAEKIAS